MKNLLLLSLLAVATVEAFAQTTPTSAEANSTTTTATTTRKSAKERRADRKAKAPQVYKGSVAEQRRLLTDADGADKDPDDAKAAKKSKHKSKEKE
jgi:hypothetical protein